jgi:hypothetical protein
MLQQIIPFRYLTPDERESLRVEGEGRVFEHRETLIEQGDSVFLLPGGSVRLTDRSDSAPFLRST